MPILIAAAVVVVSAVVVFVVRGFLSRYLVNLQKRCAELERDRRG